MMAVIIPCGTFSEWQKVRVGCCAVEAVLLPSVLIIKFLPRRYSNDASSLSADRAVEEFLVQSERIGPAACLLFSERL